MALKEPAGQEYFSRSILSKRHTRNYTHLEHLSTTNEDLILLFAGIEM